KTRTRRTKGSRRRRDAARRRYCYTKRRLAAATTARPRLPLRTYARSTFFRAVREERTFARQTWCAVASAATALRVIACRGNGVSRFGHHGMSSSDTCARARDWARGKKTFFCSDRLAGGSRKCRRLKSSDTFWGT